MRLRLMTLIAVTVLALSAGCGDDDSESGSDGGGGDIGATTQSFVGPDPSATTEQGTAPQDNAGANLVAALYPDRGTDTQGALTAITLPNSLSQVNSSWSVGVHEV